MMEPIEAVRRVPLVTSSHQGAISGEIPLIAGELPFVVADQILNFDEFYGPTRKSVGRALAVTLRDVDLAVDSVDEAMVRAFQRWDTVGRLDNPAGWVYRVGLNHARSRLRRLLRRVPHSRTHDHAEFTVSDPSIDEALSKLSCDHRAVVVCRLLLGWSEAETAEALGVRAGTVKSRLHRASTQLRSHLHHLRPEDT